MELISREEAIKMVNKWFNLIELNSDILVDSINSIPTVEERKEGEWLDAGWDGEKCSLCGWNIDDTYYSKQFKYCPNCGAKMEG